MVYLDLFLLVVPLVVALVVVMIAFWKKAGLLAMIGGILLMGFSVFVEGMSQSVLAETSSTEVCVPGQSEQGSAVFEEAYTTNSGWTQVGTLVTVDSGTADKADFANVGNDATDRRVHKSLSDTISEEFRIRFAFDLQAKNIPSHPVVTLTVGTANPRTASVDSLFIYYGTGALGGAGDAFAIVYKDDAGAITFVPGSEIAVSTTGVYYVEVDRISLSLVTIAVYSDSDFSDHVSGSPKTVGIPTSVNGFTHLHHSNSNTGASTRTLDATIDDFGIYELVSGGEVCETSRNFEWVPDEEEFPPIIRVLVMVGGLSVVVIGLIRYGLTV